MNSSTRRFFSLGCSAVLLCTASALRAQNRVYFDELVVNRITVCDQLNASNATVTQELNCCFGQGGTNINCGGGVTPEEAIEITDAFYGQLIFTPQDFVPPNCGETGCEVPSIDRRIFNNLFYLCDDSDETYSSIGLIPLELNEEASELYRLPAVDFTLPADYISTSAQTGFVGEDLSVAIDVHVLIPADDDPVGDEITLDVFVDTIADGELVGGDSCPDVCVRVLRTDIEPAPEDSCQLRHYVFRGCIQADQIFDTSLGNQPFRVAPWVRVMVSRTEAGEEPDSQYKGKVYLGLLSFGYPRDGQFNQYPFGDEQFICCSGVGFNEAVNCTQGAVGCAP